MFGFSSIARQRTHELIQRIVPPNILTRGNQTLLWREKACSMNRMGDRIQSLFAPECGHRHSNVARRNTVIIRLERHDGAQGLFDGIDAA